MPIEPLAAGKISRHGVVTWACVIGGLILLPAFLHFGRRLAFRNHFITQARAYEEDSRQHPGTCYRMVCWDHKMGWLLLTQHDYTSELRRMCSHSDKDVQYWARRVLIDVYPDSKETKEVVEGLIHSADPSERIGGALVLVKWKDGSHIPELRELFQALPEKDDLRKDDFSKCHLGLFLASQGVTEAMEYVLRKFPSSNQYERQAIAESIINCRAAHPRVFASMEACSDPRVRQGLKDFQSFLGGAPSDSGGQNR